MIGDDLDPTVLAAIQDLADALGSVPPPCWNAPDLWFDGDPETAIRGCLEDCHGLPECARLADLLDERYGVWAGVDRAELHKRRRRAA